MTDIFISYASKDRERLRPLRDALEAGGLVCFLGSADSCREELAAQYFRTPEGCTLRHRRMEFGIH